MDIIRTKSLELAILSRGDKQAEKLAILIPGRLDTKDYVNFVSHAEYLAAQGFLTIAFDPPGIWDSPGSIELYTTTNYIKAIEELIEYFGNRPTLLFGHSRGATAAILASANPEIIGLILAMTNFGPPTPLSQENSAKGFQIFHYDLPPGDVKTEKQKEFILPLLYWTDGQKYNPIEALKKCIKPKLIIYGSDDEFTSPDKVREIYQNLSEPKMIKEINCDHDYRYYPEAIKKVEEEVGIFLSRYKL
jgi:pimeloyl-ACP methyl ester carboxylesterase